MKNDIIAKTKGAIRLIRDKHVIVDADLAKIYGVETKRLNEQVKRNSNKFPEDFRFQLTKEEFENLKSQNATSSSWGGTRKIPFAYTEHGVLQAANVINSELADSISVFVIRAFIEMREVIVLQETLDKKENKLAEFMKSIGPKLQKMTTQVMDTVINPDEGRTLAEEGQDIISESINHLKNKLKKTGLENEEITARITKLLAEAEKNRALARKTKLESDQLEFMLMISKLKLVLEAQKLMLKGSDEQADTKQIDSFIYLLKEFKG